MPLTGRPFISLRTRFMALAALLTLASSAIWGGWTWSREKDFLYQRLSSEGETLVSTMAIPIINALLYEELGIIKEGGLLDNFIADIMANRRLHPLYAMVLDLDGRVLAHNRLSEYGEIYDDPMSRGALEAKGFLERPVTLGKQRACDLAMPLAIAGKRWGCLRVGLSMEPLHRELGFLAGQIILFAAVFSLGTLAVFYLVGTGLARPLITLARRMEAVDERGGSCSVARFRRDEIGLLQQSFCRMMERLRKSEEERKASFARMLENERLTTVGKIVSGVAHEVNNPLAGIQGALYHIERKGGPEIRRYADLVDKGVERIGKIVGQLLDLSRAGAIEMDHVASRVFFEDISMFARMALKSRRVNLHARDLCRPRLLHLDRDRVHQVILNLVLNAADAVGEGGSVDLQAHDSEGWYCLKVKDDGPGISAAIREKIFDPFFTTKESGKGSGMGLAISKSIAESHGGTLEASSEEGGETSFTLKIPFPEQPE